jgi:O-antigen ligase
VGQIERLAGWGVLFLPGALVVFLSFNAGGYFPGTPALVAVFLLLCLAARILAAERPFEGFSPALGICAGALCLYALWALISASWSDSTWRALVEFDRALLYLAALLFFGSFRRSGWRVRWMTRGIALGILLVCTIALITRVLPEVWPTTPSLGENRLSYPLTYWNALGLMGSIGAILGLHLASSRSEPVAVRVAAAAAMPILVTTIFFTLSRGGILAGAIGLVVYVPLARPRALLSGLLATVPPSVVALVVSYNADHLSGENPMSSAAVAEGHDVATVLVGCVLAAAVLRVVLLALDARMDRLRPPPEIRRPLLASVATAAVIVTVGLGLAFHVPSYASDQYDGFVNGTTVSSSSKSRLTDPGNNGRVDQWKVAVNDGFDPDKLDGQGGGTFELVWARDRPRELAHLTVHDGHSLYVETLSDLGAVGFVLVLVLVLTILYGFAARLGGPNRTVYAALFAAGVAWALHAGVDWDWELPAVTLWFFAMGGAALAAPKRRLRVTISPPLLARVGICVAVVLVAVVPARVAISQGKMNQAVQTFLSEGDCPRVIQQTDDSISMAGSRPDAYRLKGYCQARLGRTSEAVSSMQKAVDRDPDNWEYRYSLAVAQGAAGIDPRPAAREALSLDPLESATNDLVRRFGGADQRAWRSQPGFLLQAPLF